MVDMDNGSYIQPRVTNTFMKTSITARWLLVNRLCTADSISAHGVTIIKILSLPTILRYFDVAVFKHPIVCLNRLHQAPQRFEFVFKKIPMVLLSRLCMLLLLYDVR